MSKFLEDFLVTMPETQRKKLMELMNQSDQNMLRSPEQLKLELERLLNEIEKSNGGPTFQARQQNERIDSRSFNENMDEIAFDLASIFETSSVLDRFLTDNQQLSRSLLSDIQKKILTLQSSLKRYNLLVNGSDQFADVIHEQFNAETYTETDEKMLKVLRRDRYNNYLDSLYNTENIGDALQLAGIETIDQLKTRYGQKLSRIKVRNRIGYPSQNSEHGINKAIDGSLETYWAESVLVDEPIVQDINQVWEDSYSDIPSDGAICEVDIILNGITTVSNVQFDPFCAYPMEIISIHGYESEDRDGEIYELISPNHENPHQRSKKSVSLMNFQFPSVDIKRLRILIRQENYVKENYIINKDESQNMELWRKLSSSPELIDDFKDPNETIAEFDQKNEITGWNVYLQKLVDWAKSVNQPKVIESAKQAMKTISTGDYKNPLLLKLQALTPKAQKEMEKDDSLTQSWKAVNKLSYLYGAYDIAVFGRKYHNESIYVSKPLPLSSNSSMLSLETDEKHYNVSIGDEQQTARITDIEYYMTCKKNPITTDWFPILPINKKYVQGELLSGNMVVGIPTEFKQYEENGNPLMVYSFRFPIVSDKTVTLRRNGVPMNERTYVISNNGKQIGIFAKYYNSSSIYTVDYKPNDSAWFVKLDETKGILPTQFINDNGKTGEYFDRTDYDNKIQLKHKPYIFRKDFFKYNEDDLSYEQDNNKLKAVSPDFPIIVRVDGEEFLNITDYLNNSYDAERLLDNDGKSFAQIGNTIIFGEPIDGRSLENVTVDYYYVTTDIRMKAILRRNSTEHNSITPALYSYSIRCQSFDQED